MKTEAQERNEKILEGTPPLKRSEKFKVSWVGEINAQWGDDPPAGGNEPKKVMNLLLLAILERLEEME